MNIHLDWSVNLVQQIDKSISRCACESSEEFMQNKQCQLNMSCFYYSSLWFSFSCYFIFFNQFQLNEHWTEKKSFHFIFACIRWNTLYSDFQHLFLSCEMLSQFSWLRCVSWCLNEMTPKYNHIWYTNTTANTLAHGWLCAFQLSFVNVIHCVECESVCYSSLSNCKLRWATISFVRRTETVSSTCSF